MTKGELKPMNCRAELGILYVHNKRFSEPVAAAYGGHDKSQNLVLIPKITTSDDSLRRFLPKE